MARLNAATVVGTAVLCAVSFWLYQGSIHGAFVFDDRVAVEENKDVTHPDQQGK